MPKRTQSYDAWQLDRLTRPSAASAFLNAAREDSREMFLVALRKVAQANQMSRIAKEANIQRESLYRALSEDGNPRYWTLDSVLDALELDIKVVPKKKKENVIGGSGGSGASLIDKAASYSESSTEVSDIGMYKALQERKQGFARGLLPGDRSNLASSFSDLKTAVR
jgi:probable addiction module antidote protein